MNTDIPSADAIRALLAPFRHRTMQRLAKLSGVPFTTLEKVKTGETKNPGIETVRAFLPHIEEALEESPVTQPGALT